MRFIHPSLLFFLFSLLVPVVVHLFRMQRYKRVYFSNVRLLEEIQARQKRRARWREYLVLVSRLLLLTCLVLAFARPYIPSSQKDAPSGAVKACIYLDNSFSMQAPASESVLLDKAKEQVAAILKGFPSDAAVQLLTNDFRGEDQTFRTPAQLLAYLPEIGYASVPRGFEAVRARQEELSLRNGTVSDACLYYYVSDFQKSTFSLPPDFTVREKCRYVFVPVSGVPYANLSLDSLSLDSPVLQKGREANLRVFVRNRSAHDQWQVPLRLFVNDRQIGAYPVDLKAGESKVVSLPLRIGGKDENRGYVEIADYPVVFDNRLYFGFQAMERLSVRHIYETLPATSVRRVFASDSAFDYRVYQSRNIDYGGLRSARLIVADGLREWPSALVKELDRFVRDGGSLYLLPPEPMENDGQSSPASELLQALIGGRYGKFCKEEAGVRQIESSHPVFSLALQEASSQEKYPQVKGYYPLPQTGNVAFRSLMRFTSDAGRGKDFMRVYAVGNGLLYVLSTPLTDTFTDFARHYTFVVSLLNMVFYQSQTPLLYRTIGQGQGIFLPSSLFAGEAGQTLFHIVSEPPSGFDLIPASRRIGPETAIFEYGRITEEGQYTLLAGNLRLPLPFNYDRAESGQECYGADEISAWIKAVGQPGLFVMNPDKTDLSRSLERMDRGRELWKVFLIFALVFALLETLFLRGWSGNRDFTKNTKGKR